MKGTLAALEHRYVPALPVFFRNIELSESPNDELTKEEVAALLDTNPRYVFTLHQSGKLVGFYKSARKLRWLRQAVIDYRDNVDKRSEASSEGASDLPAKAGVSASPHAQGEPTQIIPLSEAALTLRNKVAVAHKLTENALQRFDSMTSEDLRNRMSQVAKLLAEVKVHLV